MRFFTIFLFVISLEGCGNFHDGGNKSDTGQQDNERVFSLAGIQNSTFASDCRLQDEDKTRSRIDLVTFSENTFIRTRKNFDSIDCAAATIRSTFVEHLINARKEALPQITGWDTYVYKYQSITIQPESVYIAEIWNKNSRFGYNDWAIGQSKDVAGRKYDATSRAENSPGDVGRRTFKIEGDAITVARVDAGNRATIENSVTYKKVK